MHGTHVAGIAGAVGNNGKGISGAAWNVKINANKSFSKSVVTEMQRDIAKAVRVCY